MTRKLVFLLVLLTGFLSAAFVAPGADGADRSAACIVSSHDPPAEFYFFLQDHALREQDALRPYTSESCLFTPSKSTFPFHARIGQESGYSCPFTAFRQERKKQHSFLENPWVGTDVQMNARLQVFHLHLQTYLVPPDERDAPGRRSDDPRAGPGYSPGTPTERFI